MSSGKRRPAGGPRKIPEKLPEIESLQYGEKLGQGHFSEVYEGVYKNEFPVAIKVIERGSDHLISTEIKLLQDLRGLPHIVQLYEVIHTENTVLVFELVNSLDTDDFFDELTPKKLKFCLKALCTALQAAHKKGVVHRDIKLENVMISSDFSDLKVIDWGCGTYITDSMSPKAGSRTVRSPEMLLGYRGYGAAGDCWAVGAFIYDVLTDGRIPWKAKSSPETLGKMSTIFGGSSLFELAKKLDIDVDEQAAALMNHHAKHTIESFFSEDCSDLVDESLVDLMHHLLELDPSKRYTMDQALGHPYFNS